MTKEIDLSEINIEDLEVLSSINIQMLMELHSIYKEKDLIIKSQNYIKAASLRDREIQILKELEIETGIRFKGYNDETIMPLLRELKIKSLLND